MPSKANVSKAGYWYAVGATVLGGCSYLVASQARAGLNPESALFYWYLFALLANGLFLVVRRKVGLIVTRGFRNVFFGLGGINTVFGLLYFWLIANLGPSPTAFFVRFSTVFVILLGMVLFREKATRQQLVGMLMATAGAIVLSYSPQVGISLFALVAVVACLSLSLGDVWSKKFVAGIDPELLSAGRLAGTMFYTMLFALAVGQLQLLPAANLPWMFVGGSVSAFGRFYLWFEAIKRIDVSKAIVVMTFEPVVTVLLNLAVFQSFPSLQQLVGGSVIVTGILLLVLQTKSSGVARLTEVVE